MIMIKKGARKWTTKKRFKVNPETLYPPKTYSNRVCPTNGTTVKKLQITVAPQNDIWPAGRT